MEVATVLARTITHVLMMMYIGTIRAIIGKKKSKNVGMILVALFGIIIVMGMT